MKFIDLFAGIGGFHLGMDQAGNSVTVPVVRLIAENMEVFN
ncbi:DNA cytosine methyltransferase [Levilactobacillus brevis]|nr:DNA cytosine methyltransferase [Levilactobacillus brevis]MBU7558881.1 DNA cytosine methyltransferase [Levilactobacillus brevis]MCE6010489.1 DNA cytosine methyltransferase [Levilactobacillus brevis]MCE6025051.1 DNA cytosine methyltransferase [Levilactobacillus brevis]MCE6035849.1 DNA cytosine methyltransferase [Levilactobacillus brevis]